MKRVKSIWLVLVSFVVISFCSTASAAWSPQQLNGYTYYQDGISSAFPLPSNQFFYQTRFDDSRMMTTLTLVGGTQQIAYMDASSGIYDQINGVWHHRTSCDLPAAKKHRDDWYKLHLEYQGKYYQAYCYAKYVEADYYLKACRAYHR